VFLHRVANVAFAPKIKRGDAGCMGKPAVIVSVEKQPDVDTVSLTRDIEEAVRELQQSLPDGVKADQILFRQADFIENSVHNVERVLVEAALVVAVVLFALLLNWRTTAISLTAIPLSILTTAIVFQLAGLSINTMTLGGLAIAIGELVEDAILLLVSLCLIFAILYSRYRSAVLALIILGSVPLALIGSVAARALAGPAAVGREHDRLYHADRDRRAQRHPQDQPLHQSDAARGRRVRPRTGGSR
jgi:Cu/Ag efflux pump CusA